ncbi:MAG: GatB/YqeY domain-containing protein [Deltaproteobacteria bacterium]|nr:GatB/YqeY domain-containing protein [Deltaproteobacteria bacterium]
MTIKEKVSKEITVAMKGGAGEKLRLTTLRMLLSALKYKELDLKEDIPEDVFFQLVATLSKQRREAAEQYRKGDRIELAEKEEAEIEILKTFLPEQLTEDELRVIVKETVSETGATTMADMGKLMGAVMSKVKGKTDGTVVQKIVKEVLGN